MRIAQVAPLHESVPPRFYGGTERIVSYLTEELVRQGHEVTLFASGDSSTSAQLVAVCSESLRLSAHYRDPVAHHVVLLDSVVERQDEFDLIHFHIDYLHYPLARFLRVPTLTTVHGRMDLTDYVPLYKRFAQTPLISISNSQRLPLPGLNWVGTVYHGLPPGLLEFRPQREMYLAFLGRISPEKRVDRAIEIARRLGLPIRIAAKIDGPDRDYYNERIKPLFDDPLVEYVGEISEKEKSEFLGNAIALLFPVDWPEPFGLVMIESMACGTPVVGFRRGSVPEIVETGVTGYVVDSVEEAVQAVRLCERMDRLRVRKRFLERFSVERMTGDYLRIYERNYEWIAAGGLYPSQWPGIRPGDIVAH